MIIELNDKQLGIIHDTLAEGRDRTACDAVLTHLMKQEAEADAKADAVQKMYDALAMVRAQSEWSCMQAEHQDQVVQAMKVACCAFSELEGE